MSRFALLGCLFLVIGCSETSSNVSSSPDSNSKIVEAKPAAFNEGGAPTVEIKVSNMECKSCAGSICRILKDAPGVVDVKADADTKLVTIAVDEESFDPDSATQALNEKFFKAELIVAEETVETDPVDNAG